MNNQPLLIRDAYDFGPPPPKSRETPWEKLYRFFFGDDIFISYARADAARYVPSLAARLAAKKHICFFDQLAADPSEDLPERLKKKILRSTVFVLVGTRGAVASSFVRKEVELFRRTRRPFIPVDVDGALVELEGWRDVVGVAKISEEGTRVRNADPSPEVINLIKDSFRYTRRSKWLRASLLAGVSIIFITAAVSLLVIRTARAEAAAIKRQSESRVAAANQEVADARQSVQNLKAEASTARNQFERAAAAAEVAATRQKAAELSMRRAQELERQSAERAEETSRREAGSRAALLARVPGMEANALALAVQAAVQSVAHGGDLPDEVMDGITASADVADYSLPLEDLGARALTMPLISPDGEKILGTAYDPQTEMTRMVLWDSRTGKLISDTSTAGLVMASSFSRDGKRLATLHSLKGRQNLAVWDLTGAQARPLQTACDTASLGDIALDSDGSRVMYTDTLMNWVTDITICEIATGRKEVIAGMYPVSRVAFTPEGEPAFYGPSVEQGAVTTAIPAIYFPRSGRKVVLKSPGEVIAANFVGFGDDGSIITMGRNFTEIGQDSVYVQNKDGSVRRFAGYRGSVFSATYVDGQAWVVTVSGRTLRVADKRNAPNFIALRAHARTLDVVAFSPDDRTILTVGDDGKGRLWDARTGRLRHTLAVTDELLYEGRVNYYRPKHAAFRADGTRLVTANDKGEIQIWDVDTGRPVCPVPGRSVDARAYLLGVSFLAGGDYVLALYSSGAADRVFMNFLDARTCSLVRTLYFDERFGFFSFSQDGTAMITGTFINPLIFDRPELKLWSLRGIDLQSEAPIRLSSSGINMPPGSLRGLSFDGTRMLTVTQDDAGQLWVSGGRSPVRLEGRRGDQQGFFRVVLSADGTRTAALLSREARVWDTRSGKLLVAFYCDTDLTSSIPFSLSPDGSKLIIVSRDNTVRIYPTSPEGFLVAARRLLGK